MKLWATAAIFPQDPWRLSSEDPDLIADWQTKISELSINLRYNNFINSFHPERFDDGHKFVKGISLFAAKVFVKYLYCKKRISVFN